MKKYLIFDFDGTLIDSFAKALSIYNELAISMQVDAIKMADAQALRHLSSKALIQQLQIPLYKLPKVIYKARQCMRNSILSLPPFDEIPAVLVQLHQQGYQFGIVSSNSKENICTWLCHHHLLDYFNFIHSSSSFFGKRRALEKILKTYQLNPKETFYIGDETRDIEAAKQAGLISIAVTWGFNSVTVLEQFAPQYMVHQPQELLSILSQS